jgi:hypothetical protein
MSTRLKSRFCMRSTTFALLPGLILTTLSLGLPGAAVAEPTPVSVYVLSRDAKFVGSSIGGVRVTIQHGRTGEVLAQGVTSGGTGDTDLIMRRPREHGDVLITPDAAHFSATLDLTEPTPVQVTVFGPLDYLDSANTVSATQWLLPGKSLTESASWIIELPGLVVDLHDAPALVRLTDGEVRVPVRAMVRMMCGCPLTPGGLWDSNEFDIEVQAARDGVVFASSALSYAGEASEFAGELLLTQPGEYQLSVRAIQPRTGNAGISVADLVVDRAEG